jgi:hypothetical protein
VNHHRKAELAEQVTQRLQESLQMEASLCAAQTAAAATAAVPAPAEPVPAALSPSLPKQFAAGRGDAVGGEEEEEEEEGAGQQDQRQQQDQQQVRAKVGMGMSLHTRQQRGPCVVTYSHGVV